ncbi:CAP domain-containing protein [Paenibacillus sp. EPM92]|uniref:CAP domain-containing protein n=1 Tax=Paenibacillus sp. EPM92 TaxID=1561195 RepID=UPI0019168049|nr:CAP domain-containing protein [Paenibacillus sp. EPM92]
MKKLLSLVLALTLVIGGISFGTPLKASAADLPKEHKEALNYLNEIRRTVGIKELELDPYLNKAAQNHADYLTLHGLTSLNTDDGHWEDSNKAGFTGENPGDRAKAVGYDNSWVSEVISYDDDTLMKTLDGFLNKTVIHRDFLFSHADIKIGFGISGSNVVFNIGKSASEVTPPEFFSYPYNGQKDVDTYFSSKWERPDLLKKFGVSKSGFAISYYTPEWADSFTAKITDSKGNDVPFYSDEMGLVHLYPKQELKYNETYTVNVKYGSRNDTWSFTTKSDPSNPTKQSVNVSAKPTASKVLVNGKELSFQAYNIDNNNYFKLRDLAMVLNGTQKSISVGWDGEKYAISLESGKPYGEVGGELTVAEKLNTEKATLSTSIIYLDGKEVKLTAYLINGNNYFKLRDVAAVIDFGITWDGKTNTIGIDSSTGYVME